jgi:hypothetical protein
MAPAVHDSGLSILAAGKIVKLNRHKPLFPPDSRRERGVHPLAADYGRRTLE